MRPSYCDVVKAAERLSGFIHPTPIMTSHTLDKRTGRQVFFKCENFQKTGSFKSRGALNAVLRVRETNPDTKGVVTHSSGNHGQALAWAAQTAGLQCVVVVPNNTKVVKMDAIKGYGAELVLCEPTPDARTATCQKLSEDKGFVIIPPFDHCDVIAGQGTIAVELMKQIPDVDAILVPVSGGGMISGIAIAAKSARETTKIFAVEPKGKDLQPCLESGERLWTGPPRFLPTIADGIRFQQVGHLTFPIMHQLLEKTVFSVTDAEIVDAMQFIMERMKLVIEPSSGAGVAAVLSQQMAQMDPGIAKVAVILCGGNLDLSELPW